LQAALIELVQQGRDVDKACESPNGPFKGVQQHAVRTTEFSVADVLYFELDFLTEKGSIIAIGSDKLHFGLTSFPCPPAIF